METYCQVIFQLLKTALTALIVAHICLETHRRHQLKRKAPARILLEKEAWAYDQHKYVDLRTQSGTADAGYWKQKIAERQKRIARLEAENRMVIFPGKQIALAAVMLFCLWIYQPVK